MAFLPLTNLSVFKNAKGSPKVATVINNNDPLKKGRIKVSLPGIFDPTDELGSNLRWVHQYRTSPADTFQSFDIPCVGDNVYILWPYNNQVACYKGMDYGQETDISSFSLNYPYDSGITAGDMVVKMDSGSNTVEISSKKGKFTIRADSTGAINIMGGRISIISDHNINIKAPITEIIGDLKVTGQADFSSGACGTITSMNAATVSNGLISSIE